MYPSPAPCFVDWKNQIRLNVEVWSESCSYTPFGCPHGKGGAEAANATGKIPSTLNNMSARMDARHTASEFFMVVSFSGMTMLNGY